MAEFRCSFCAKTNHEAAVLIAGPTNVYICDECTGLCAQILVERSAQPGSRLTVVTLAVKTVAEVSMAETLGELESLRDGRDRARAAVAAAGKALLSAADACGLDDVVGIRCVWCGVDLASKQDARDHAATCEEHPAVIRLHEIEVKAKRKVVRRDV